MSFFLVCVFSLSFFYRILSRFLYFLMIAAIDTLKLLLNFFFTINKSIVFYGSWMNRVNDTCKWRMQVLRMHPDVNQLHLLYDENPRKQFFFSLCSHIHSSIIFCVFFFRISFIGWIFFLFNLMTASIQTVLFHIKISIYVRMSSLLSSLTYYFREKRTRNVHSFLFFARSILVWTKFWNSFKLWTA